jgi:hypothetical protein
MQLFFSPVQQILFANIESGPHKILLTNLDTGAPFAISPEYVRTENQMSQVILTTVRCSFHTLSTASAHHSTNKTHCVLPLVFILNETLLYVSIHKESSSGNTYQIILHATEVAILYTHEHNVRGVKESSVQHL